MLWPQNMICLFESFFRYWTPPAEKSAWKNCGCRTFSSIGTAFYHLGTLAFGSLIIGIIRFIQSILNRVEKTLGKYNNDLTKCLLCMCKCCLWCLEKFMKFLNRFEIQLAIVTKAFLFPKSWITNGHNLL